MTDPRAIELMLLQARLWSDPDFLQFVMGEPSGFEDSEGNEDMDQIADSLDLIMAKYITTTEH